MHLHCITMSDVNETIYYCSGRQARKAGIAGIDSRKIADKMDKAYRKLFLKLMGTSRRCFKRTKNRKKFRKEYSGRG